jgi:hypothetical protein
MLAMKALDLVFRWDFQLREACCIGAELIRGFGRFKI